MAAASADSTADADDEDSVISRLHKCDTLFTTGSSQTEEHLIFCLAFCSCTPCNTPCSTPCVEQDMKEEWGFGSKCESEQATKCENLKFTPQRFEEPPNTELPQVESGWVEMTAKAGANRGHHSHGTTNSPARRGRSI